MDSKNQGGPTPKHRPGQSNTSQPAARPGGGTHSPHPETVKPNEPGKAPTKKSDSSHVDARTNHDKDGNEQQR